MKELQRRIAALEERLKPEVDYVELMGYFARQIEHDERRLGFPEPNPNMVVPKGFEFCFLFGRNEQEWNETRVKRDAEVAKMISMIGGVTT